MMLYLPLLISVVFVFIQLRNLSSYRNEQRSPSSLPIEKNTLNQKLNFYPGDLKYKILNRPLVIADKVNKLRTRNHLLDLTINQNEKNISHCEKDDDCVFYNQLQQIMENESEIVAREIQEQLEVSAIELNSSTFLPESEVIESCSPESFRPDPYDPIKVINLNFHFPVMNNKFSPGMFVEDHNGLGNTDYTVFNHMEKLIENTNLHLTSNHPSNHSSFQEITNLETKILVRKQHHDLPRITQIKNGNFHANYHFSSSYEGGILDSIETIKNSGVFSLSNDGINLVFQEQYGSPLWNPPVYAIDENGNRVIRQDQQGEVLEEFIRFKIKNGNAIEKLLPTNDPPLVVMANEWMGHVIYQKIWNNKLLEKTNEIESSNFNPWERAKLIAEAIGFVGGLDYIWINSNKISDVDYVSCNDHPTIQSSPWCGETASNNIMDTNCYKNSWSPCQLTIAHYNYFNNLKHLLYLPSTVDHEYDLQIPPNLGDVYWDAPHDLIGDVYIGEGTNLHIGCQVTKPSDANFYPETSVYGLEKVQNR